MNYDKGKCFLCGDNSYYERIPLESRTYYDCGSCGRYTIDDISMWKIDRNIFASYLCYYNKIFNQTDDKNYFCYIGSAENFDEMHNKYPYARLITNEEVTAWYPKNFSEKIDYILLGLARLSEYPGKNIKLPIIRMKSIFFVKWHIGEKILFEGDWCVQIKFMANYMHEQKLLKLEADYSLELLPEGWKRIDTLQKSQSNSKQAFIAMPFSDQTKSLREAIRKGIEKAGYIAQFIDEKEHNNQIVPEILYEIRNSKFMVAELTGHNNGAYYEAGYAAGLGKEVIHICNKETFGKDGHFDVKQKATILWETEDEIPVALCKRIKATIG
jgi:nucleoside 2-deoxyribosyltransferase